MKLRSQSCASRRVFVAGIARHPLDVCVKIKFLVQTPQNSRFSHRSDGWNCSGVMITLKRRAVVASRFTHSPTLFFVFLQRSLQQVRYLSSAPRTVECRPRVKGRSLSFPLRIYRLGWKKKMTVLFLYAILVLRLLLSHPFVGRWHRRFTGSGGGAINSRRRCLSWCLVIYSDRFINFWWL